MKKQNSKFTEAEIATIQTMARRTWEIVGADYLTAAGEGKRNPMSVTISRAEVMEVVCDANRLEDEIRRSGRTDAERAVAKDLADRFESLTYQEMLALIKPAFKFSRYGW